MSSYIDYYVDHDLDTSNIKNLIADLEKRPGHYKPRWGTDVPKNEIREGFYLGWRHWCYSENNEFEYDPYDETKNQDVSKVSLFYFKKGYEIFDATVHHGVFNIWVKDPYLEFPCHFQWFGFLRKFLGSDHFKTTEDDKIKIRKRVCRILKCYKSILAPFHSTTFLAEGEYDDWVEHAENGECSIDDLLTYDIADCEKPVAINANTTFEYDNCQDFLVFLEKFENV